MACIHKSIPIERPADEVWDALRDVGEAHRRLFPGVLTDAHLDGDARVVTFSNGMVVRERIVSLDDQLRRFSYAAVGGRALHHHASFQVFPVDEKSCEVVWITDLLPDEMAPAVSALMEQGAAVMQRTLQSESS